MPNRMVGRVSGPSNLVALLERYPGDILGGGPGTLPDGFASSWGSPVNSSPQWTRAEGGGNDFAVVFLRGSSSGVRYFLGLFDSPEGSSSWEAWRVSGAAAPSVDPDPGDPASGLDRARAKVASTRSRSGLVLALVAIVVAVVLSGK